MLAKWKRSLRYGNDYFKKVEPGTYYRHYGRYLETLLQKSVVRLAVLTDDHDVLLGFSTHREHILDYVYVHKDQRHLGIATKLIPDGITTYTHLTKSSNHITKHHKDWVFNPFI